MTGPPRRPPAGRPPDRLSDRLLGHADRSSNILVVGVVALALLVVIWVLLLPPFALLRSSPDQCVGNGYCVRIMTTVPAPPSGFTPASRYYAISLPTAGNGAVSISLPLLDPKGTNGGLAFYSLQGGVWQRVAPAQLDTDGLSGQGQIQTLPTNLILLKRNAGALQLYGALPAGKTLSPEAVQQIAVLNPSGFVPNSDGSVNGEQPPLVPGAEYDVIPAVVAVTGDPAQAVSSILAASDKESAHITALANLASRPGNDGVELDYLSVPLEGRQAYSDFVTALAQQVHKDHHLLGVELPAPILTGSGWNTGAYDWGAIAKSADYVKLQPDLDQSLYRKQMPDLLKYLTTDAGVDARKLVLVTSPYSIEKTDTTTRELTRLDALSIASQIQVVNQGPPIAGSAVTLVAPNLDHDSGGSGLVWDSSTASVSFVFKVGESTHVIWIQNVFSEGFKLEYAQLYHLGGVAVADASNDPAIADLWPVLTQFSAAETPTLQQPNPQLLVPSWLADGKPLQSDGKTALSWPAPSQPGTHSISLIVSDGDIRVARSIQVQLQAGTPGTTSSTGSSGSLVTATPRPGPLTATPSARTSSSPTPNSR